MKELAVPGEWKWSMRDTLKPTNELFELSLWGGAIERRYRKLRPEVEAMPWESLDLLRANPQAVRIARSTWTNAAFQEHRTGAACAATLQALITARAPVDMIAMASRFALDEMVHVELCARLAMKFGGGAPISYDPKQMIQLPDASLSPRLAAAELVVRNFCVGEALSIPVLRGSWHAARQPLIRQVLARIVKDEAAHGAFGWIFLDWAEDDFSAADREHLATQAALTIDSVLASWKTITVSELDDDQRLGWMESKSYLQLARQSLQKAVLRPLAERGLDPRPFLKESV